MDVYNYTALYLLYEWSKPSGMRIEVLGAGGAWGVPRPFCPCPICVEARQKGAPYTRYGPSLFIHDLKLLIDTPEEIAVQLNRAGILRVDSVFYSHWHPDHTAGFRVWEGNWNSNPESLYEFPPVVNPTTVYLPVNVAATFEEYHALKTKCDYAVAAGVITVAIIPTHESVIIQGVKVTPLQLAEEIACGFLLEWTDERPKRVLILIDEVFGWLPPPDLGHLDLVFIPAGVFDLHPLTGERRIPLNHPLLKREITHGQVLDLLRCLDAERVVFVHLNETDRLHLTEYQEVARRINAARQGIIPEVMFAYDTLILTV